MPTVPSFRNIENNYDIYRGREHAMKIINFKKEINKITNRRAEGVIWK